MTHLRHRIHALAQAFSIVACMTTAAFAQAQATESFRHGEPPRAGLGGPLELTDQRGQAFSLSTLGTQPALVFFGFTRCAMACPAALLQAREFLAQYKARRAPPVLFVTLDPLSDSPQALGRFLSGVDPRITGLTGTPVQIQQAARRYGVATQGSDTALEHSARWYVVDAQATVLRVYSQQDLGAQMAADLTRWQQRLSDTLFSLRK
jgi:protein SCO1/2